MACYIHGQKEILMLLLLVATFSIFVLPYTVLLPIFARDILKVGPKGLGFLFSAMGLGALIGAIMVATIAGQRNKLLYLWGNALLFGALILAFSLCNQYYLALFLLFLAGMTMVGFLTTANAYVQLNVPDDRRGRIMGLYSIVFLGMMPLGSMLSGSLSQYIGVQRAVSAGAILAELITFGLGLYLLFIMGSRRRPDHKY
jgi:MFS family permease